MSSVAIVTGVLVKEGGSLILSTLITKLCVVIAPDKSDTSSVTLFDPKLVLVGTPCNEAVPLPLTMQKINMVHLMLPSGLQI